MPAAAGDEVFLKKCVWLVYLTQGLCVEDISTENTMKPDVAASVDQRPEVEKRFQPLNHEILQLKAGFNRLRALMNQENEQKQRPVARIYSGSRAVKA